MTRPIYNITLTVDYAKIQGVEPSPFLLRNYVWKDIRGLNTAAELRSGIITAVDKTIRISDAPDQYGVFTESGDITAAVEMKLGDTVVYINKMALKNMAHGHSIMFIGMLGVELSKIVKRYKKDYILM